MKKEKALFLVKAMNDCCMAAMELADPSPNPGATLQELLDAAHFVRDMEPEPNKNGKNIHYTHPSDRLVAAAYAAWNYKGDPIEDIQPVCVTDKTTIAFLRTEDVIQENREKENV